jgi:hypothetical protein
LLLSDLCTVSELGRGTYLDNAALVGISWATGIMRSPQEAPRGGEGQTLLPTLFTVSKWGRETYLDASKPVHSQRTGEGDVPCMLLSLASPRKHHEEVIVRLCFPPCTQLAKKVSL